MAGWKIENHICAVCCGRILSRRDGDKTEYRCSNCGVSTTKVTGLCCCGIKIQRRDAGIRCVSNDNVTPEWPGEIVAKQVGV